MAAAYRTHVASGIADGGSTTYDSASITTTAGDTLYVYVVSSDSSPVAPSGVVWNPGGSNQSLTNIKAHQVYGGNYGASLWRLVAPSAGTAVVRATWPSAQGERLLLVVAASDVDTTTPNGTIGQGLDATGTTFSVSGTATTTAGQTVLAFASLASVGSQFAFGSPSGTERVEVSTSGTPYDTAAMQDTVASGASTTMTWSITPTSGGHPPWLIWVVPLNDAAGASIAVTPDPSSVSIGSNQTMTITRTTAAPAGGVTYNLTSGTPTTATVPATATILEGTTSVTFTATSVGIGTTVITATNAADSGETDSVTHNVTSVLVKKAKFVVHSDFQSATNITIDVFQAPGAGALTGARLGAASGINAEATLEGGQAVIKVPATSIGATGLSVGTSVRAVFKGTTSASSPLGNAVEGGSVATATGSIIEE